MMKRQDASKVRPAGKGSIMDEVIGRLKELANEDRLLIGRLSQLIRERPEGRIEVAIEKGKYRHYLVNAGRRLYLGVKDSALAKGLMEKRYYQKLLQRTLFELKAIEDFLKRFDPNAKARVFEDLHEERRKNVEPLVLPDELFIEQWRKQFESLPGNPIPIVHEYLTSRGDVVRSKSEKILTETFLQYDIPFEYEAPVGLADGPVYPDFTLLNKRTRKTYYLAPLGLMDSPEDADNAVRKLNRYERNGILPGDQLIISMETSQTGLSISYVESQIRSFLL